MKAQLKEKKGLCAASFLPLGCRGQAAVTDSLYFILIVTFLSVFLFGFANTYGNSVREQISAQYNTVFATNALKAILYSSTPRDISQSLYSENSEVDYLLAIVKEDYSDDQRIDDEERKVLAKTISSIMSPVQDTADYAFYITIPDEKKLVFFFIHTTNFSKDGPKYPGRYYLYSAAENDPATPQDESHLGYFCGAPGEAAGQTSFFDDFSRRLLRLLVNVGPTSQASSSIKLVKEVSGGAFDDFKAQAELVLWDAVWLGTTDERQSPLFDSVAWQCEEANLFSGAGQGSQPS